MSTEIKKPLLIMVPKVHPKAKTKLNLRFQTWRMRRKTVSHTWQYEFVEQFYHLDDALKSYGKLLEETAASLHPDLMDCGIYDVESKMYLQIPR